MKTERERGYQRAYYLRVRDKLLKEKREKYRLEHPPKPPRVRMSDEERLLRVRLYKRTEEYKAKRRALDRANADAINARRRELAAKKRGAFKFAKIPRPKAPPRVSLDDLQVIADIVGAGFADVFEDAHPLRLTRLGDEG